MSSSTGVWRKKNERERRRRRRRRRATAARKLGAAGRPEPGEHGAVAEERKGG